MGHESGRHIGSVRRAACIGMVAQNAAQKADLLWSVFGIGPFRQDNCHFPSGSNGRLYSDFDDFSIEVTDRSATAAEYADFVAARGQGFCHLLFETEAYDETLAALCSCGCQVLAAGRKESSVSRWALVDTFGCLGWYVKLEDASGVGALARSALGSNRGPAFSVSGATLPRVELGPPTQIGIVVRDAAHTADLLGRLLGIGPFHFLKWPLAGRPDMQGFYNGKPGRFYMMLAFASVAKMEIELLQPIEGENLYSDFLAEKGEGLHHLLFEVTEVETKLARLAEIGIGVKMWGTARQPGARWMYLDTVPILGWSVELRNKV